MLQVSKERKPKTDLPRMEVWLELNIIESLKEQANTEGRSLKKHMELVLTKQAKKKTNG